MKTVFLCSLLLLCSSVAIGQHSLTSQPGYVDFSALTGVATSEPKVEVSLSSTLLGFLAAATREEDPELASTLGKLKSIRLNVFELSSDQSQDVKTKAQALGAQLLDDAWEEAVKVKGDDALIQMYLKLIDGKVAGMTVMMVEDGSEAVFMNIVGEIEPEELGRVAGKFGVDLSTLAN